jgi:hypothetical protein
MADVDGVAQAIRARGLTVGMDLSEARTTGDPALLDRMVGNLVDNTATTEASFGY